MVSAAHSSGTITLVHRALSGITSTIAGIMSATGKFSIFAMRRPVAMSESRRRP